MTEDFRISCLIVDDEQSIRTLCRRICESIGFHCVESETAEAALAYLETEAPNIVLSDLKLPNSSGMDLLRQVKIQLPRAEVAIMTGHGTIDSAVQSMKLGAYDYVLKPFRVDELKLTLQRMEEKVRLVFENEYLRERVRNEEELSEITGSSAKIQDVLRMISRLKDTRTPVLITGESGTGKELVARAIHFRGSLAKRPFVAVDCGSLVPTLIESELFGYEKSAFTGALRSKIGLFQSANGGTIFLDEIGELSTDMQAKLLRVLQEKEIRPVGSNEKIKIDVRVIAATNRDLESAVKVDSLREALSNVRANINEELDERRREALMLEEKKLQAQLLRLPKISFRKDLFFRLNVVTIHVPALRERRGDIPALVHALIRRHATHHDLQVTMAAMNCLMAYDWPGNVRELENCIERALALGNHKTIDLADLPVAIRALGGISPAVPTSPVLTTTDLEDIERATIERVFEQVNGDKVQAGKMLGISRATLYRKLKRYNIGLKSSTADVAANAAASGGKAG